MYADDTCLVYAETDLNLIENRVQEDLTNIIKWAHDYDTIYHNKHHKNKVYVHTVTVLQRYL